MRVCLLLLVLPSLLAGCGNVDGVSVEAISTTGGTRSHRPSESCTNCHRPGGEAKEWFTAAGTVRWSDGTVQTEGAVSLTTQFQGKGTLVATMPIDALGNFYTTEPLPLPDTPLFPQITSTATGRTVYMPYPIHSGACNFCHLQNAGGKPTFMLPK